MPRFNHMELTVPKGELDGLRADLAAFFSDVFGFRSMDVPILGQQGFVVTDPEASQFILVTEQRKHMSSPGFDHLGFLYDSREEVDALLEKCRKWQERDSRVQIKEYEDLRAGPTTTHAFYVRFLLPIWFDIQTIAYDAGSEPARRWRFA